MLNTLLNDIISAMDQLNVSCLSLQFPLVTFEDLVEFSFKLVLDPSGYFDPGTENIYTVLPVDVTYTSLQRPDRSDTSVHYFPEPFVLEFLFDVPSMFSCIYTKKRHDIVEILLKLAFNTNQSINQSIYTKVNTALKRF